jgi:hypothetical protein
MSAIGFAFLATEADYPPDDDNVLSLAKLDALIGAASILYDQSNAFQEKRDHALYLMCYHTLDCMVYLTTPEFHYLCGRSLLTDLCRVIISIVARAVPPRIPRDAVHRNE